MSSAPRRLVSRILGAIKEASIRARRLPRPEDRFAALIAAINRVLEEEGAGRVIVVGGFALELLVGGAIRTLDVDLVVQGYEAFRVLEEALRLLGKKAGATSARGPVLSLGNAEKSLDLVASSYRPVFPPIRVVVPGFGWFYVEAPEELLLRYLREWVYWGTVEARARVLLVLGVLGDRMSLDRVLEAARQEDETLEKRLREALELLRRRGIL